MGPIPAVPPIPELGRMDEWALAMMGVYEQAAVKVRASNDCLATLRAKGVIR